MYGFVRYLVCSAILLGVTRPAFASWNPLSCIFVLRLQTFGLPKKDPNAVSVSPSPFVDDGFRAEEDSMKYLAEEQKPSSPLLDHTVDHTGNPVKYKTEEPLPTPVAPVPRPRVRSLEQISRENLDPEQSRLVQSMLDDKFYKTPAFFQVGDLSLLQDALSKGVTSFKRRTFRSSIQTRAYGMGYDFVRYEIKHPDGSESSINIYKQAAHPSQNPSEIGAEDYRPTVLYVTAATADGKAHEWYFNNGSGREMGPTLSDDGSALAHSLDFVTQSLSNRGIIELKPQ